MPGESSESAPPDDDRSARADEAAEMRRAVAEIRREGWKIAVVYATIDAVLATLASNLALSIWRPSALPASVPIPAAVVDVLRGTFGLAVADPTVSVSAVVGVLVGVVVFAVEVAVRVHRPLVEQFEAANPGLRESLRTARDAVEAGDQSRMARRLYEDVLAELRTASSVGLLDLRRVTGTVVVVALVSLASIQLAVVDLSPGEFDGPDEAGPAGGSSEYRGLQDASSILGEAEDVPPGESNLEAVVDTSGSGSGDGTSEDAVATYDNSGFAGPDAFESQQAGFAESERLEDAELIREYNLRIREGTEG